MRTIEEISMAYNRAIQLAEDSERKLSELVNVLLLGNSFLVAAFAVILGQPIRNVVHYVLASVGIVLCLLLLFGINSTWHLYRMRTVEAHRLFEELKHVAELPSFRYIEERPWFMVWGLSRLFEPGIIYRLWLPCLFLFMWVVLLIFAID